MRYHVLACDYDGTLASDGITHASTLAALERLRCSGRKLILVTGRELEDFLSVFPQPELFDRIVAENGGLLYRPSTREEVILGEPAPERLVAFLRAKGVSPISTGRVIISTREPHEAAVLDAIRILGLEWHVVFNRGAVMVLPSGVNKATGLRAALDELKLSAHNVVAVGDGENDHALLSMCECAVSVANAIPHIRECADFVTSREEGAGVAELIDRILASDLEDLPEPQRLQIPLGVTRTGEQLSFNPYSDNWMIAGTSAGGKSSPATGILERLVQHGYQVCILDPEGDYQSFESAQDIGDARHASSADEVIRALEDPYSNAVVNLSAIPLEDRPLFLDSILPRVQELRARTGHPHWLVLDETHQMLPAVWDKVPSIFSQRQYGTLFITAHPDHVSRLALESLHTLIVVGERPEDPLRVVRKVLGRSFVDLDPIQTESGEALLWRPNKPGPPVVFRGIPGRS